MALMITKDPNTGERTRTLGIDRSKAVAAVVEARSKVPPIERSGAPSEAPAETATPAGAPAAAPEPEPPKAADPGHLVEIERRERALEAKNHELEMLKRDYERMKSSPEEALRAAGYDPDRYISRYLGEEKPAGGEAPKVDDAATALQKRVEAMEAERDQERAANRARARRQEIESLIPADSEDYDAFNGLRDFGAMDQFLGMIGDRERAEKRGLGPNEIKALLGDFEGASRKNVQAQLGRLAKTKWFRNMVTELLKSDNPTVTAASTAAETAQPHSSFEAQPDYERRGMSLRGREREVLRERIKSEALKRRGL